jgi:hypothetical protein
MTDPEKKPRMRRLKIKSESFDDLLAIMFVVVVVIGRENLKSIVYG